MGCTRALVLCTPEQYALAQRVSELLGDKSVGIFDRAVMHVPIETAQQARAVAQELGADCAVAVGGGSTTGLGKARICSRNSKAAPRRLEKDWT